MSDSPLDLAALKTLRLRAAIADNADMRVEGNVVSALICRLEAADRTLAEVKALLPDWFAEPSECDPAHKCDGKVGCGASSCFASELMAAIYGEDENKWPRLSEITDGPNG